jgi:3-oxoacyl-[acyl-carrier-protein] synthase II
MADMADMVVTGLGVVAPGVGKPAEALDPAVAPEPGWFDLATALPGRGYRRLPPACQYLLAAARAGIADAGDCLSGVDTRRRGVVIGTNNASAALLESMDRTIIDSDAGELAPLPAPFMAMSTFASRLSTEHTIHGFNLTANSPRTAGLEAVALGTRALAFGRAAVLIVGAAEDAPPPEQLDTAHADVGAAVLVCEPAEVAAARGAAVYGTCVVRTAFLDPDRPAAATLDSWPLDQAWAAMTAGPRPAHVDAVLDDSPVCAAVGGWLAARVGAAETTVHPAHVDGGCLAPLRRVLGLLATGQHEPAPRLVVTASAEGNVALARLAVLPRSPRKNQLLADRS